MPAQGARGHVPGAVSAGLNRLTRQIAADILGEIAGCLVKTEQYRKAEGYLRKAIEIDESIGRHYYLLGTVCEKTGKSEKAVEMYRKAIDIDPKDPVHYHALGFAYESAGKHKDAIACFKKAMELEEKR